MQNGYYVTSVILNGGYYSRGVMSLAIPMRFPRCKLCGKLKPDVSRKKKCRSCAIKNIKKAIAQVKAREGEYMKKWTAGVLRYIRKVNE